MLSALLALALLQKPSIDADGSVAKLPHGVIVSAFINDNARRITFTMQGAHAGAYLGSLEPLDLEHSGPSDRRTVILEFQGLTDGPGVYFKTRQGAVCRVKGRLDKSGEHWMGFAAPVSEDDSVDDPPPIFRALLTGTGIAPEEPEMLIGCAVGSWRTVTKSFPGSDDKTNPFHVKDVPKTAIDEPSMVQADIPSSELSGDQDTRVVVFNKQGGSEESYMDYGGGQFRWWLSLDQVTRVELQRRPYTWILFKNVKLPPS